MELREVFKKRGLYEYFYEIFGSPDNKEVILKRELESGNIQRPALFIGDSKYDYKVAKQFNIDFLFSYGWTEITDWTNFVAENQLDHIESIAEISVL
jgi:phosphoglycolate phosphatase-like HAD superfamily hydrolase